jgi:hypothetical protein
MPAGGRSEGDPKGKAGAKKLQIKFHSDNYFVDNIQS